MKTIDERQLQKRTKEKQSKTVRSKGNRNYSKRVRVKSNLELALSIILKQRELSESKLVAVECRCLKI